MNNPGRLAKEISKVCEELDYELVTDDQDWQDWRFEEDGEVKTVSIDVDNDEITVEILEDDERTFFKEYTEEDGDVIRLIRRKL